MASISDDKGYNQGFTLVPSTKIRMQRRADFLAAPMANDKKVQVLEIGCGTGEIAYWIAEKKAFVNILGTDICEPFIQYAKQQYQLSNLEYDILDFNHPEKLNGKQFDYIIGNGILHHLYYGLDEALLQFKKLLLPGGKIVFMEPNIYNPYCAAIFKIGFLRKKAKLEPDEMAFSKSFITEKLMKLGYKDIKVTYKDFLLPGVPMFMVKPIIAIGNVVEKIPVANMMAQSIFIEATIE